MALNMRRSIALDLALGVVLLALATGVYATVFLHVPPLTEVRDFLLRFGQDAKLWDVLIPSGNDYRPFSWKLFAWQHELFGLSFEALNLAQFFLLGLCAFAAYIHLRQLLGNRIAAFGAGTLWLLSLPVAHAAFWQATQHDKLAFLFTAAALIATLHAIRSDSAALIPIAAAFALACAALAAASKPVAFMLPAAFVAQVVLFTPLNTLSAYLRSIAIVLLPAAYVSLYAFIYMLQVTPEWRAHTMQGDKAANLLVYMRNLGNVDYDGNLWLAGLLVGPVLVAWAYASWRFAEHRVLVYLFVIFSASIILLSGAAHATSFYLLLPLFAFTGSIAAIPMLFANTPRLWKRACGNVVIAAVVVGLLFTYRSALSGEARLGDWSMKAQRLAEGYKLARGLVDPSEVKSVSFFFPREPDGHFYFFSDGAHQTIDPSIPSFLFGKRVNLPVREVVGEQPSDALPGELSAFWSDDLQLTELRLSGAPIYSSVAGAGLPLRYTVGESLSFEKGGSASPFQSAGWSSAEDHGTWTVGPEAALVMKLDQAYRDPLELVVVGQAFTSEQHPEQIVDVLANGRRIAHWIFRRGDVVNEWRAPIPAELAGESSLTIGFLVGSPRSPASVGLSADTRALGIMVQRLQIVRAREKSSANR